jgi:hypothetical protein
MLAFRLPDYDLYATPTKTVPGFNGRRGTKHSPLSPLANTAILRVAFPAWSRTDHALRALELRALTNHASLAHSAIWVSAFQACYNRPPEFFEFRISGIGDDGLPESAKTELRTLAVLKGQASGLAFLHEQVAGVTAMKAARAHGTERNS